MRRLAFAWFDWWLIVAACFLFVLGLVAIGSGELAVSGATFPLLKKQLIAAALGMGAGAFILTRPAVALQQYAKGAWALALGLLIAVLVFGRTLNGATGWFVLGGFAFQPIEWAKIAFVLYTASVLAKSDAYPLAHMDVWRVVGWLAFAGVLIGRQPDLGGALVLSMIAAALLFFAGLSWRWIGAGLIGAGVFLLLGWSFLFSDYQKDRILTFMNPASDPLKTGYNVNQAMIAIGSGGWFGRGFAEGSQSQLRFLPEGQTDFIFAVIVEEFGFIGATLLLLAFFMLILRIFMASFRAKDRFSRMFLFGAGALFFVPMVVHIGTNMGILPATGITLPFVSYGGSSLLMTMILFAMVLRVTWEVRALSADVNDGI